MEKYKNFPIIVFILGFLLILSSIVLGVSVLINIFMDYNTPSNYIWGLLSVVILSLMQLYLNRGWTRITEVSAQFTLDFLPVKQMTIEADFSSGNLTKEEAMERKHILQKEVDFLGSMNDCGKYFSKICRIINIGIIFMIVIIFANIVFKLIEIDSKYISAIIIYGIISQLTMIFMTIYSSAIVTKVLK